jgi:hypothetical protein
MTPVQAFKRLPDNVRANILKREEADEKGLVGRNKGNDDWMVVGDQAGLGLLLSVAIAANDHPDAERAFVGIEKTFGMMNGDGTFPMKLGNGKGSNAGAQASSNTFFLSQTVPALAQAAQWDPQTYRSRVDALKNSIRRAAEFSMAHRSDLLRRDDEAPNRLALNANAFAQTGKILGDRGFLDGAKQFVDATISRQREDGAFIEAGGPDSSYQATSLFALGQAYVASPSPELKTALQKGLDWYLGRFSTDGIIDASGNSRTAHGATSRRGTEKRGHNPPAVTRTLALMAELFPSTSAGNVLTKFSTLAYKGDKIQSDDHYVRKGGN